MTFDSLHFLTRWPRFGQKLLDLLAARFTFILAFSGTVLLTGTFFFCFIVPLTPGRLERTATKLFGDFLIWKWISSCEILHFTSGTVVGVALVIFPVLMFAAYSVTLIACWRKSFTGQTRRIILVVATGGLLLSTFALPNHNTDIFNYISRARVMTAHAANPHYVPASEYPDDPLYKFASPRIAKITGDKFALWTWLSAPLAKLGGDDPTRALLVFRGACLLFNLGNLLLIFWILRKISPEHILAGLVTFAWNPIVLVLGQSKTDTVMVFFLLLGIYLLVLKRPALAMLGLAASVLIKLITLPLVGIYWLRELRLKNWRGFLVSAALFAGFVVVCYTPLWQGSELITNHLGVSKGEAGATSAAAGLNRMHLLGLFAAFGIYLGLTCKPGHLPLLKRWAIAMLFFAVLLARISFSWYLITAIAVIALCGDWRLILVMAGVSFSSFLFNVWYTTSTTEFVLPNVFDESRFYIFLLPVAGITAAVLLLHGWRKYRHRKMTLSMNPR